MLRFDDEEDEVLAFGGDDVSVVLVFVGDEGEVMVGFDDGLPGRVRQ